MQPKINVSLLLVILLNLALPFTGCCDTVGPEKPLAVIKLEIHSDIPYALIKVNDSESLWFGIDCGASSSVIDSAVADRLNLKRTGNRQGTGAGAGTFKISYLPPLEYNIGGLKFKTDSSYCIDLSGVSFTGNKKLAGLIGYDFFKAYVVIIDYKKKIMTVYDNATFQYTGTGEVVPITMKRRVPFITGTIWIPGLGETANREWLVDSGSGDTFNDELLVNTTANKEATGGGIGLGTGFQIWRATADSIQIGRFKLRKIEGFSGAMKIGSGILKYFKVIFDYQNNRMIWEPQKDNLE